MQQLVAEPGRSAWHPRHVPCAGAGKTPKDSSAVKPETTQAAPQPSGPEASQAQGAADSKPSLQAPDAVAEAARDPQGAAVKAEPAHTASQNGSQPEAAPPVSQTGTAGAPGTHARDDGAAAAKAEPPDNALQPSAGSKPAGASHSKQGSAAGKSPASGQKRGRGAASQPSPAGKKGKSADKQQPQISAFFVKNSA